MLGVSEATFLASHVVILEVKMAQCALSKHFNFHGAYMKKNSHRSALAVLLGLVSVGVANANTFSMKIVADNDYAVFGGTATGINDLLYQNNSIWNTQIQNLSTLTFTLPAGDTKFYVLAMGGGGQENISGLVNGVDMTAASVLMSSDVQSFLTGYNNSAVAAGTFNANLADVQTAFSSLTWAAATTNTSDIVIGQAAPNGIGFQFDDSTAHLFAFSSADVGVQAVPEPSSAGLALLGFANLMLLRRRPRNIVA